MFAGLFSFIGKVILVVCIAGALVFKYVANDCRKQPSPQLLIKKRLEAEDFKMTVAEFISMGIRDWDIEHKDKKEDYVLHVWCNDRYVPVVDYSGYENEGRDPSEKGLFAKYRITVDEKPYYFFSEKCALQTLFVYYNTNNPQEIYHAKEIEKVKNWNDLKEQRYREQEEDETLIIVKLLAAVAGVVLFLFIVF